MQTDGTDPQKLIISSADVCKVGCRDSAYTTHTNIHTHSTITTYQHSKHREGFKEMTKYALWYPLGCCPGVRHCFAKNVAVCVLLVHAGTALGVSIGGYDGVWQKNTTK